ncbi:mechanosensitive ion channel family protein [Halalkalicoccus ordinarius]|uniref:mechanosensitive ion channel family protein n=1 Tax=Halalkalicoccus ordinarius TaxID=3116651 RepID=UPI00300F3565
MTVSAAVERRIVRYAALIEGLLEFVVAFALLYAVGRFLLEPAIRYALDARGLEPTLDQALRRVLRAAVVVGAVVAAAGAAGFGHVVGGSAVIVAAATVALGFAAQDVVGNLVSGVFIVTDPSFNIGDWIEWDGKQGIIVAITFRSTRVRTFNDELITVPNSELVTAAVTNHVVSNRLRIVSSFEVDPHEIDAATDALLAAARDHPEVLDAPEPTVRLDRRDGALVLDARYWIASPRRTDFVRIRSEYLREATDRLREAGVEVGGAPRRELSGELSIDERGGSSE